VLIGEVINEYNLYNQFYKIRTNNIVKNTEVANTLFNQIRSNQYVACKIPRGAVMIPIVFLDERYEVVCAFLYCYNSKPKVVRRFHALRHNGNYYLLRITYEKCFTVDKTNNKGINEFIIVDGIDKIVAKHKTIVVSSD
jgi:hypothetical protein